jgi:predicted nucleotidyltransferase
MIESVTQPNPPQTLEQRKQEALKTADKCRQILLEQGAQEVILFGSLSGESPWHWQSDLDLAVRGMSEKQRWDAYSLLEKITPDWLKIDLVALEELPDFIQCRILREKPMPTNKYSRGQGAGGTGAGGSLETLEFQWFHLLFMS